MPQEINLTAPEPMSDYGKFQVSTEIAFNALIDEAKKLGFPLAPVMGLMYLPDQATTQRFKEACAEILNSLLIPKPSAK